MDYVPTRTWEGNKVYLLSAILAYNLTRELQMIPSSPVRTTQEKHPTLWKFKTLGMLRRQITQRAVFMFVVVTVVDKCGRYM